jgi:hypothetical protein
VLLEKVQDEHSKAVTAVTELQAKVDEAGAARAEDENMLLGTGTLSAPRLCFRARRS